MREAFCLSANTTQDGVKSGEAVDNSLGGGRSADSPASLSFMRMKAFSSSSSLLRCLAARATLSLDSCDRRSSEMVFSKPSMWSLVLWRIARCASRSFARLRSSCAAERVLTLRVPALEARFLVDPEVLGCSEPEEA